MKPTTPRTKKQAHNPNDGYNAIRPLALQKYLELGPTRSLAKLQGILEQIHQVSPTVRTMKNWSRQDNWKEKAASHDSTAIQVQLPYSPAGLAKRKEEVLHAKTEFNKIATGAIKRVQSWLDNDEATTKHIRNANDAKILAGVAVEMVKMSEVLEGRVSDRVAEEKTVSVEDVRDKAVSGASLLLERCTAIKAKFDLGSAVH